MPSILQKQKERKELYSMSPFFYSVVKKGTYVKA